MPAGLLPARLSPSGAGPAPSGLPAMEPVSRTGHVVAPGDTLWSLARRIEPTGDVRPLVDELAASRRGRPLQVGEVVVVPSAAARSR